MAKEVIIETKGVTKVYGMGEIQVRALDGVSIRIASGEFVSIMGPSGSGKSTLMNILGCLDRPTEGRYLLAGEDVSDLNKNELAAIRNRRLGFIFQSYNLLPRMSALENVMLPLLYSGHNGRRSTKEQEELAMQSLEIVGLADRMRHMPKELSGGQQQRVAIARALVNEPLTIMADEPTGNLDTKSGTEIMELLHDLNDRGRTIVMVTHDPEIGAHSERAIRIRDGKVDSDHRNGKINGGQK